MFRVIRGWAVECIEETFLWLNENAGAVTAMATILLAILTAVYVVLTKGTLKHVKRQADYLDQRERTNQERAVRRIIHELLLNATIASYEPIPHLLHNQAYHDLWALDEIGASSLTTSAVRVAYNSIEQSNALYIAPPGWEAVRDAAWSRTIISVKNALLDVNDDKQLERFQKSLDRKRLLLKLTPVS